MTLPPGPFLLSAANDLGSWYSTRQSTIGEVFSHPLPSPLLGQPHSLPHPSNPTSLPPVAVHRRASPRDRLCFPNRTRVEDRRQRYHFFYTVRLLLSEVES